MYTGIGSGTKLEDIGGGGAAPTARRPSDEMSPGPRRIQTRVPPHRCHHMSKRGHKPRHQSALHALHDAPDFNDFIGPGRTGAGPLVPKAPSPFLELFISSSVHVTFTGSGQDNLSKHKSRWTGLGLDGQQNFRALPRACSASFARSLTPFLTVSFP